VKVKLKTKAKRRLAADVGLGPMEDWYEKIQWERESDTAVNSRQSISMNLPSISSSTLMVSLVTYQPALKAW
jgi:hypothetical protein